VSETERESGETRPPGRSTGMGARRLVTLAVLGAALVAGAVWGAGRWRYARAHVSTDNAQVDGHVVPVLAKVGGYVQRILVEDNVGVRRGELAVVLDDSELRAHLAAVEAELAAARAAAGDEGVTGQVEAQVSAARAGRQALEARLASARAEQERSARDLERMEDLAAKEIVSVQQLDAARAGSQAASAAVSALEQEVAAARASESSAAAATRVADARLSGAKVAVATARERLGYARVAAPVSGVVARTQVEVGQLVQPGQPLAAVVADSVVWITANLKETETADVRPGERVEIEVDAYPGCEAIGVVESVSPATGSKFALLPPDNATGNFTKVVQRVPVRIGVAEGCGAERPLRPGMSVVVHIETR